MTNETPLMTIITPKATPIEAPVVNAPPSSTVGCIGLLAVVVIGIAVVGGIAEE